MTDRPGPGGAGDVQRTLYGHVGGRWAILDTPVGLVTAPTLMLHVPLDGAVELEHLGAPIYAIRRLAGELRTWGSDGDPLRGRLVPVVDLVAQVLGVTGATSSRWLSGKSNVANAPAQGWARLVVALLSPRYGVLRPAPGWTLTAWDGRWFDVATVPAAEQLGAGVLTATERFEVGASGALGRVYQASLAEVSV